MIRLDQSGHLGQYNSCWATSVLLFDTKGCFSFYLLCFHWEDLTHQHVFLPAVRRVWGIYTFSTRFLFCFSATTTEPWSHIFRCDLKVPPLRMTCSPFKSDKAASLSHFIQRFTALGRMKRLGFSVCGPQGADLRRPIRCPERENPGGWGDLSQTVAKRRRFLFMTSPLRFAFISQRTCLCVMRRRGTSAVHLPGRSWRRASARRSSWMPTQWGVSHFNAFTRARRFSF